MLSQLVEWWCCWLTVSPVYKNLPAGSGACTLFFAGAHGGLGALAAGVAFFWPQSSYGGRKPNILLRPICTLSQNGYGAISVWSLRYGAENARILNQQCACKMPTLQITMCVTLCLCINLRLQHLHLKLLHRRWLWIPPPGGKGEIAEVRGGVGR